MENKYWFTIYVTFHLLFSWNLWDESSNTNYEMTVFENMKILSQRYCQGFLGNGMSKLIYLMSVLRMPETVQNSELDQENCFLLSITCSYKKISNGQVTKSQSGRILFSTSSENLWFRPSMIWDFPNLCATSNDIN